MKKMLLLNDLEFIMWLLFIAAVIAGLTALAVYFIWMYEQKKYRLRY